MGHKTIIMNLIKGQEVRRGTDRCGSEKETEGCGRELSECISYMNKITKKPI